MLRILIQVVHLKFTFRDLIDFLFRGFQRFLCSEKPINRSFERLRFKVIATCSLVTCVFIKRSVVLNFLTKAANCLCYAKSVLCSVDSAHRNHLNNLLNMNCCFASKITTMRRSGCGDIM